MQRRKRVRSRKRITNPEEIPELLSDMINAKPEEDEVICKLADEEQVGLIAFIAPYIGVRISPIQEARAFIGLPDEFGVEALIRELKSSSVRKAYLLVNSPGGTMESSYKIARAIRMCLGEIVTFVPHIAASGGTLLALTGNKIVMGPISHITPLDVQIPYKETSISAATFMRFFARVSEWFRTVAPDEAPYPQRALADRLDPFLMEEWSGLMDTAIDYVEEILKLAGYQDSARIAEQLVTAFPTHGYVITPEKAGDIGLNVEDSTAFHKTWQVMRYWLSKYMFEQEMTHCIRYALPQSTKQAEQSSTEEVD
jgi:hypothetical protein